mmetsp:Transcript_21640/g.45950  ORF Transcript_21640/g.45950 Transcript_21640/m.45950 type:complete len:155 (-) Transcript_21640:1217-1681(-)
MRTCATDSLGSQQRLQLYNRSYPLPPRWPFPGQIRLVMESRPGSCDLYGDSTVCCDITTQRVDDFVERHTTEVLGAILTTCPQRTPPCRAADIGANNGWMSAFMLSLGAHVISVEPQADLVHALRETVILNCWANRSVVHNAFACASVTPLHAT